MERPIRRIFPRNWKKNARGTLTLVLLKRKGVYVFVCVSTRSRPRVHYEPPSKRFSLGSSCFCPERISAMNIGCFELFFVFPMIRGRRRNSVSVWCVVQYIRHVRHRHPLILPSSIFLYLESVLRGLMDFLPGFWLAAQRLCPKSTHTFSLKQRFEIASGKDSAFRHNTKTNIFLLMQCKKIIK